MVCCDVRGCVCVWFVVECIDCGGYGCIVASRMGGHASRMSYLLRCGKWGESCRTLCAIWCPGVCVGCFCVVVPCFQLRGGFGSFLGGTTPCFGCFWDFLADFGFWGKMGFWGVFGFLGFFVFLVFFGVFGVFGGVGGR